MREGKFVGSVPSLCESGSRGYGTGGTLGCTWGRGYPRVQIRMRSLSQSVRNRTLVGEIL